MIAADEGRDDRNLILVAENGRTMITTTTRNGPGDSQNGVTDQSSARDVALLQLLDDWLASPDTEEPIISTRRLNVSRR